MEPTRAPRATLVDLLDRVLEKGLVLDADLIIHVAGVPLLGVKLKALLAGMETMLEYGIWEDWDEAQRVATTAERRGKKGCPRPPGKYGIEGVCLAGSGKPVAGETGPVPRLRKEEKGL